MNLDDASAKVAQPLEPVPLAIVGAGQAGLALSRRLVRRGVPHAVLDGAPGPGVSWRRRWDSLQLFTPPRYSALPGLAFPTTAGAFPTKDEMADYLAEYVDAFELPVRWNIRVRRVRRGSHGAVLETDAGDLSATRVVIATGAYRTPRRPAFDAHLPPELRRVHAHDYRNPDRLPGRRVLVVGAGNSGVQIASELARAGRDVVLAGRSVGVLPRSLAGVDVYDVLFRLGLLAQSRATPWGRAAIRRACTRGDRLLGIDERKRCRELGITRTGRILGFSEGGFATEGEPVTGIDAVVWATGYRNDYRWVDGVGETPQGTPPQWRGRSRRRPEVFFLGQPGLHYLGSSLIGWADRDAAMVERELLDGHPQWKVSSSSSS